MTDGDSQFRRLQAWVIHLDCDGEGVRPSTANVYKTANVGRLPPGTVDRRARSVGDLEQGISGTTTARLQAVLCRQEPAGNKPLYRIVNTYGGFKDIRCFPNVSSPKLEAKDLRIEAVRGVASPILCCCEKCLEGSEVWNPKGSMFMFIRWLR
ncbi:hypothetical protein FB451DRAFT_1180574 [Mycena latifolia]|nr:hypothetical protein FB451DRAFT_1180574 [Mycena latifolia]